MEGAFYLSEKLPVVIPLSDGSYLTPSPLFAQAKKRAATCLIWCNSCVNTYKSLLFWFCL